MATKKYWSFMKFTASATVICSVTAISVLGAGCAYNKNNNNNSQSTNITIKNESPINQEVSTDNDTSLDLFVDATCTKGDSLGYQWYVNKDQNSNNWEIILGATSSTYKLTNDDFKDVDTETTWKYKVEITSNENPKDKVISKEYSVNIKPKKHNTSPIVPNPPTPDLPPVVEKPETPSEDQIYNTNEVPTALKFDYDKVNVSDLSSAPDIDFLYTDKITKRYNRTVNSNYYKTDLLTKYENNGFKYPSYNYNYETGNRKYLTVNGEKVNVMKLVYEERVDLNGKQVKYSDEAFIKDEISKNQLKAHPAAKTWYEKNVSNDTQAVDKKFTIGPTKTGLYPLGLYAPAGEVITLTFDDETFDLIKSRNYSGLKVVINDNYWDNKDENNTGRISNRYPFVSTTFKIDPKSKTLQFGSPFGGNISVSFSSFLQDATDSLNSNTKPVSFTISNAVESLNYVHGFTTESDWNRQVKAVEDGIITAPNMSALYSWSSMNIPFTAPKKVANKNVKDIAYPYETFKKWNNFQFLSAYTARSYSKMLSIRFCDDIWGGGGAWGGRHLLSAPISWATGSFLSGVSSFNIKTAWGIMHEMNHTYQQDDTFFKIMGHNKTNQMSITSLVLLSDTGRRRSETNILQEGTSLSSPGWTYLNNSFASIEKMNKTKGGGEYATYASILFAIGAKNYMDYTRWDAVNHKNTAPGWTAMKEIKALSDYFKVDFWPAFQSTYRVWHDSWPASYDKANADQRAIIDELKKYSAVEFVGNLYAAGSYLYNGETKEYRYTGDVNTPYEIPGYQDYTFDFENFINSSNLKFKWSNMIVDSKSKNGVPLEVQGKKLNYLASQASYNDEIDEFNVTIVPDTWDGKPENYVPGYKWKIKVRHIIQDARINLYTDVTNWNNNTSNHAYEIKKHSVIKSFYTRSFSNQTAYELKGKTNNLLRARFSFIAPTAGKYVFNSLWSNSIDLYINNSKGFYSGSSYSTFTKVYEKQMNANEVVTFEAFVYNESSSCTFNFEVKNNNQTIDLSNTLLGSGAYKAWLFLGSTYTFNMYKTDDRFQYKPRFENYLSFLQSTNSTTLTNNCGFVYPNKSLYTLKSTDPSSKVDINRLYTVGSSSVEIWKSTTPATFSFDVDFTTPTKVGSLRFGHRTDNHYNARPTNIKVTGIDEKGNSIVLCDGNYSSNFSSRSSNSTIVNLNSETIVKTLKIELVNNLYKGLVLNWFSYSPEIYVPLNNNIAVDNNYIAKTKNWSFISNTGNDYQALSSYGSKSLLTSTKYAAIDFNLKNSRGFKLIGTTTTSESVFDIYINNKIYKRDVKVGGANKNDVQLFRYALPKEVDDLRVTIVNKSNSPLIISFIQTFGYNGAVYTSPIIKK